MSADEIVMEAEEMMEKAVNHILHEFKTLHTGKASPAMVENISVPVESYGTNMNLKEIAAVTTPDARTIQIQPWDKSTLKPIEKAILTANIGLTPSIQGNLIRVPVPELSRERRQELVRMANKMAEDGRIGVRAGRHFGMDGIKKLEKNKEISEDDRKAYEKDIQATTDKYTDRINTALKDKEADLLKV